MAKVFYPGSDEPEVVITDIGFHANDHAVETLDFKTGNETLIGPQHKQRLYQLDVVDQLYGPLHIGSVTVTRQALDALGATTNGQPLNGDNTFFRTPNRFFLNTLQFNPIDIETRIKLTASGNDYRLPTLLFEIASERSSITPPLLNSPPETPSESARYRSALDKLLNAAQQLNTASLAQSTFSWVNKAKSNALIPTGFGLQAFGIYSGLRGLQDAIRNKDAYQTVFNGASVAAEVASIGVEAAVSRQAMQMLKAGQSSLGSFAKTSFALRLGRGSGLIASVLTLPFDIVAAVDAFKAAANASGKEATDHYVSAALSITSAAMSVMIGAAALAGFSSAGPAGLAAGLILAVGSQIWGAIREVDEIDDYITLTVHERLRTGWFAFWTISPDDDIQARYTVAKATAEHTKQLRANALALLQGTLKDSTEAIVNGKFGVELEQVTYNTWNWWTGERYQATRVRPRVTGSDDIIDAHDGVTAEPPGAVLGTSAEHKGIHWYIGGGNDTIVGVEKKPNVFHYGAGIKKLTGGEKDDVFIFEGSRQAITRSTINRSPNWLFGGTGNDTVILSGNIRSEQEQRLGYHVDLEAGHLSVITPASQKAPTGHYRHAVMESVENVEILEGGANVIKGTTGPNIIKSRGNDSIEAGAGDDQIFLLGGNSRDADGGPGEDVYAIAHKPGRVSITEDGRGNSVIALDWRADLIDSWRVKEGQLIVTSCFDSDDWQRREVVINNVYQTSDPGLLQNNKLTFMTKDGYHLVPDLPDMIGQGHSLDIEAVVVQLGTPRNPSILHDQKEHQVPHDKDSSYFLSRRIEFSTLDIKQKSDFCTTLHLDYAHSELTRIEAHYNAYVSQEGEASTARYGECSLTLYFGVRRVLLKNLASSDERYSARDPRTGRRAFSVVGLHHVIILIMNDGSSYRLTVPSPDEGQMLDEKFIGRDPVKWKTVAPQSISLTKKKYAFLLPLDKKPYAMGRRATCALLTSPSEQTGVEVLIGEGATYLVHLSQDMTLRLSTPGALASASPQLPHASVWELDATHLGQVEIKLDANLLQVGRTVIHLPVYEAQDLIDPIRVITAQGIVYAVDVLFERVYVEALDGRYFTPPVDPFAPWPSELSGLTSKKLKVMNVALKDGSAGALSYHLGTRQWTLETDKARPIVAQDLKKTNLCDHHLSLYRDLAREGLSQIPPTDDGALRLLREKCVALAERLTPGNSKSLVQTLTFSLAFGMSAPQLSGLLSLHGLLPAYL